MMICMNVCPCWSCLNFIPHTNCISKFLDTKCSCVNIIRSTIMCPFQVPKQDHKLRSCTASYVTNKKEKKKQTNKQKQAKKKKRFDNLSIFQKLNYYSKLFSPYDKLFNPITTYGFRKTLICHCCICRVSLRCYTTHCIMEKLSMEDGFPKVANGLTTHLTHQN